MKVGDLVRESSVPWIAEQALKIGLVIELRDQRVGYYIRVLWSDGIEQLHTSKQVKKVHENR